MKKNPHAVALGRKGGKAKGKPKGFAAMTKEEAAKIRDRKKDSARLDAMIKYGLSVNIPVLPYCGGIATRGVFQGDDGPITADPDARKAIDMAIEILRHQ